MEKQAETTFIPMKVEIIHTMEQTHTIGVYHPDCYGEVRAWVDFSFLGSEEQCKLEAERRSSFAVTYSVFALEDLERSFSEW